MQFHRAWTALLAGICAIAAPACSSDDADPLATLTDPPTTPATTPAPTTTAPTTAAAPTAPPTTEPPTTPVPATTADDVKTQIQADLTAGRQLLRALQMAPRLDGLDAVLATVALPGSPYYEQQVDYINELVRLGDVVTMGDPPVDSITVEDVTFEGSEPYTAASVTVCDATNLGRITPAANSPIGEDIIVTDPQLIAYRYAMHVAHSDTGWVVDDVPADTVYTGYPGAQACG